MSAPTLTPTLEDYGEAGPASFVLVNGTAFGILLPNGVLYRDQHAHLMDVGGKQPTVWFQQDAAEIARGLVAVLLDEWYGITAEELARLRVVELELDTDGIWKLPEVCAPEFGYGYRPLDLDTEELSEWPCGCEAVLDVEQARRVMRQHKECAGQITCKARGRARAVLARAGLVVLNRRPSVWTWLDLPDTAPWGDERIGGRALVHLAGVAR
ncbi:hypothetical protein [Nocardia vaccinii]|uniref:hypothetical protein n=1 Tax=Nocardia vaccinii TaxID=1822 RepID=UPI000AEDA617|nr:hypothetical protein [Nocardia vaccinii]